MSWRVTEKPTGDGRALTRALAALGVLLLAVPSCGGRDAWLHDPLPERSPVVPPVPLPADAPRVRLTTPVGEFVVALYAELTPKSAANFLRYVDEGFYDGTVFHRIEPEDSGLAVIQGGGLTPDLREKATHAPIENEAASGLSNRRGTIALARLPDPHSATAQFFINYLDNRIFDYQGEDAYGYAVFGVVVEGMEVVDRISMVPTEHAPGTTLYRVPMVEILIKSARREEPGIVGPGRGGGRLASQAQVDRERSRAVEQRARACWSGRPAGRRR